MAETGDHSTPTTTTTFASPAVPIASRPSVDRPSHHPNPSSSQAAIMLAPVPKPQHVPVVTLPHLFLPPTKRITSSSDIRLFHSSLSGSNFLGFIAALSDSVVGLKISDLNSALSETLISLQSLLRTLSHWIDEIPPLAHNGRYGNPAYRQWHQKLRERAGALVTERLLPQELGPAGVELSPYFLDSFGNSSRIDYGTGHETNFAAFLYCLARVGLLKEEDYQGVVLTVFVAYLDLMRKLQTVYLLEPAGSHGVWGLDDYHFLPFVFGSAQLVGHRYIKPKSIHSQDVLDGFSKDYMYLGCVAFVKKVKKGLFAEHSPLLDDISGVPTWSKVNSGMLKMYKAEVLEKVPIMQHFLFGSLIEW